MSELRDVIRGVIADSMDPSADCWNSDIPGWRTRMAERIERTVRQSVLAKDEHILLRENELLHAREALAELEAEVRRLGERMSLRPLFERDPLWQSFVPRIYALLTEGTENQETKEN